MAEFRKLSDVEVVAEPAESANVLIEENGIIKKAPKTAVGGAGGDGNYFISFNGDNYIDDNASYEICEVTEDLYQKIADRLNNKMNVEITLYDYRYYDYQPSIIPQRLYRITLRDDDMIEAECGSYVAYIYLDSTIRVVYYD